MQRLDPTDNLPHSPAGRGHRLRRHLCRARLLPPRGIPGVRHRLHQRHHGRRGADQALAQVHAVTCREAEAGARGDPGPRAPAQDEGVPGAHGGEAAAADEGWPPCARRPAAVDGGEDGRARDR